MFCKSCRKEIADDARFCPSCGARQEMEIVQDEVAIAGPDSCQGAEENSPADTDDTAQSQSLDTGDAPAGTEKKESVAANKKKKKPPRIVTLLVSLVVLCVGPFGFIWIYQKVTNTPLFLKTVEIPVMRTRAIPTSMVQYDRNLLQNNDEVLEGRLEWVYEASTAWNYLNGELYHCLKEGDKRGYVKKVNQIRDSALHWAKECEYLRQQFRGQELQEWLEEQRILFLEQLTILNEYCSQSSFGYVYYESDP